MGYKAIDHYSIILESDENEDLFDFRQRVWETFRHLKDHEINIYSGHKLVEIVYP